MLVKVEIIQFSISLLRTSSKLWSFQTFK